MIEIGTYSTCDKESVIALVLHCQNDGTRPVGGVEDSRIYFISKKSISITEVIFGWQRKTERSPGISVWGIRETAYVYCNNSLCRNRIGAHRITSDSSCTVCFWSLRNYMDFQG